jgi:hypothetical protein
LIQIVEYEVFLSNGEKISITELDPERIPYLKNVEVLRASLGVIERCSFAPRSAIEDAKRGYDKSLLPLLRSPEGALLRAWPPICRLIVECAMADIKRCTLRNIKKGKKHLPECWEFYPPDIKPPLEESVRRASIEIGTVIGMAWRSGSYPIIVDLKLEDFSLVPQ